MQGAADDDLSRAPWRLATAAIWLVVFFVYFFSLDLPNNQGYPRSQVWLVEVPGLPTSMAASGPHSGWRYLSQRLDVWLVAGIILAGAWGCGHLLLRLIDPPLPRPSSERTVFAFTLGLSALSLVTLAFGLAGLLSRVLLGSLIAVAVVGECVARLRPAKRPEQTDATGEPADRGDINLLKAACVAMMAPFVVAMVLGAALPSTDFDVNEYHLQGPKEFYQAGRITFLPHNVYTSFPFLTEMLSLLAMVLRGDWFRGALAGKTVLMTFAPLSALALYAAGRRWFSPAAGWLAATVFLTTPWVYRISTIAYAEGGLTCYLFVALLATMIAVDRFRVGETATREFLLAGLMAGSAMACKYPGVLSVVIPLALLIAAAAWPRNPSEKPAAADGDDSRAPVHPWLGRIKPVLAFSLGVVVVIGPWLLKNLAETGNPVYPLMYTLFGGEDWDVRLNAQWREAHSPPPAGRDHSFLFWLTDVSARNDWLSPLLYGFAPLAFLWTRRRKFTTGLWVYAGWLFLTWWLLVHRVDRFWVPMIAVVALLAGAGAAWSSRPAWVLIGATAVFVAALFNFTFVVSGAAGYNAYLVDLDYARTWTAERFAPAIAYLNKERESGDRVLCVGEAQVFDAQFPLVYNTAFDHSIFQEWVAVPQQGVPATDLELRPLDEVRQKLEAEGITHILVNWREMLRYRETYHLEAFATPKVFSELRRGGIIGSPTMPSYLDWETLSERQRREIENWAPELKATAGGNPIFIAAQVFPVIRSEKAD